MFSSHLYLLVVGIIMLLLILLFSPISAQQDKLWFACQVPINEHLVVVYLLFQRCTRIPCENIILAYIDHLLLSPAQLHILYS